MPGRGRGRGRGGHGGPRRIPRLVEPALLLLLHREPVHGYGLAEGLASLGLGEYQVDSSAVYRALRSLEETGMVLSIWDTETSAGPPRRVYTITADGEEYLAHWVADLRATESMLRRFLEAYEASASDDHAG